MSPDHFRGRPRARVLRTSAALSAYAPVSSIPKCPSCASSRASRLPRPYMGRREAAVHPDPIRHPTCRNVRHAMIDSSDARDARGRPEPRPPPHVTRRAQLDCGSSGTDDRAPARDNTKHTADRSSVRSGSEVRGPRAGTELYSRKRGSIRTHARRVRPTPLVYNRLVTACCLSPYSLLLTGVSS